MIDMFRRWFQYECEMHLKTVESLESVPSTRRSEADFKRAVAILAHMVSARRVWLERFGERPASDKAMFPADVTLESVAHGWAEIADQWTSFLGRLDNHRLAAKFEYQSLDAGKFRNSIEEVLTQLFGHAWYHRGQIAILVRNTGGQPAVTDYIYWCRETVN